MPAALRSACCVVLALVVLEGDRGDAQAPPLPERLDRLLADVVRATAAERRQLHAGGPITVMLDGDPTRVVSVFGAIWINASPRSYVEAAQDIERFERGGKFRITRRISDPPRLGDFAALRLPSEDVADLARCRPGSCEIKLSQAALEAMHRRVDFRAASPHLQVDAFFREQMLDLTRRYRAQGNAALPVYHDRAQPTLVAHEFRDMLAGMPAIEGARPEVRRSLIDYPRATLPNARDLLYWQDVSFGLKPTIRVSHLVIAEAPDQTVVASKMLYASHYFVTALELRVLLPDPARGSGFWFLTVSTSRVDGLSGFTGFFVRRRVRGDVERGIATMLAATRRRLEDGRGQ
jgi:hypothetical protein